MIIHEESAAWATFHGPERSFEIEGQITASGNISATGNISSSGTLYGAFIYVGTSGRIYPISTVNSFFSSNTLNPHGGLIAQGNLQVTSHITSSGNISSSSDIIANELNVTQRNYTVRDSEAGNYHGDVVSFGTGPGGVNGDIVQGELYCLDSSQHWEKADADLLATSAGMLGIAIADDDPTFLVKGIITNAVFSGFTTGQVLYVHTEPGDVTNVAPSNNTEVVRVVGYSINGTNRTIYFDPDKTWVQVTA